MRKQQSLIILVAMLPIFMTLASAITAQSSETWGRSRAPSLGRHQIRPGRRSTRLCRSNWGSSWNQPKGRSTR
jgi:hypothetical protein